MYIIFALAILLASLLFLLPFIRTSSKSSEMRKVELAQQHEIKQGIIADRVALYELQSNELQDDLAQELIDEQDYQASQQELKQRLLREVEPHLSASKPINLRFLATCGFLFLISFCVIFYYFHGAHRQLTYWQSAVEKLPEFGKRSILSQGEPLSLQETQQFALALRTKLADTDGDAVAWMLLGRTLLSLQDVEGALAAFNKSYRLDPNKLSLLVSFSQALIIQNTEKSIAQAGTMLSKALTLYPQNPDALSLLALLAFNRGDYTEARSAWNLLISQYEPADPRHQFIKQKLSEVKSLLAGNTTDISPDSASDVANGRQDSINASNDAKLNVTVNLAPSLKDSIPEGATLFIFAQATTGPKMPLAVVKSNVTSFPITVSLSDENAMMQGLTLSSASQVVVTARISKDDKVDKGAGDLQGTSISIDKPFSKSVAVEINSVL